MTRLEHRREPEAGAAVAIAPNRSTGGTGDGLQRFSETFPEATPIAAAVMRT
ncbi:hypothetical protein [Nocardia sp. NPDC047654]|uniref:hypothetical protein n=1 Tax=Nocardia sp. NPDC047654 TaxID=3364314 RepID=UPI00371297C6